MSLAETPAPAEAIESAREPAEQVGAELLVCVKCRAGAEIPADERRPGQALYDSLDQQDLPEGLTLTAVECLQNCDNGCTVALRGGDARWTYVFGALTPEAGAEILREGAGLYIQAADGVIPWRQRPEHFKRNCVARIPPLTPSES